VLFFLSGAAALVYEVVWMRMLSFVFGNTTYAVSVVLAVFLGGLAIGAFIYGRVADRGRGLLRVYGLLEAGAAAIALVLPVVLLRGLTPVYTWIYQRAGESTLALTAARLALNGALLIGPAILLGGTLPLLIRFIVRRDRGMEGHIGRLYGLNALGAVAGSFAAGFLLLPFLGLGLSNAVGAALGFCVAAAALLTHRALGAQAEGLAEWRPAKPPEEAAGSPEAVGRWLLVAFALSGFAALAYEVLWTRLLAFFLEGTVYAFSAMLCVYLLGLALGSLLYSVVISRLARQVRWFVILEVVIGVSAAGTIPVFLVLRRLHLPSMSITFWGQTEWLFVGAAAIMIVPTVLIGAVFPLVCGVWARSTGRVGASVGQAYVVNTVGTVAGSLAAGFVLVPAIGARLCLYAMAGLSIFAGLMVWTMMGRRGRPRALRGAAAVLIPAALFVALNHSFTAEDLVEVYKRGRALEIEWVKEDIDGTVTVQRRRAQMDTIIGQGDTRVLAVNATPVAGTDFALLTTQKLQAHIAMLLHPKAERVLHIGFGTGGTAYSVSQHPVERIDCVEISKAVIEAAPLFPETNRGVLEDSRVSLYLEDARTFVRHTPHEYDVILSDLAHPMLAGQGFFYSVDYLRDCRSRLKAGGIFSTWMPIYALNLEGLKVMIRSIREVFPYVYIWHSEGGRNQFCVVQGMLQPLEVIYEGFAQRMAEPGVLADLAEIGVWRPESVLALLLYDHNAVDRWVGEGGQLNTDDNGYLEFIASRANYQFPSSRKINFLFAYPDLVLNSGGSALDYMSGAGGAEARWRERLRREVEANRHVLRARLYELGRQDRYDLLALMSYRRALAAAPDHFVAKSMIAVTEGQMKQARAAAAGADAASIAREQWLAALTATERFEEAAGWAEALARQSPGWWNYVAVANVLRKKPEELARILRGRGPRTQGSFMGIPRTLFEQVIADERAAAGQPGEASNWQRLGQCYQQMAGAIWSGSIGANEVRTPVRMSSLRLHAVAGLLDLAAARYGKALSLAPGDADIKFALASVEATRGELEEAIELLEGLAGEGVEESSSGVSSARVRAALAQVRATEGNPFAFLEEAQAEVMRQVERRREEVGASSGGHERPRG